MSTETQRARRLSRRTVALAAAGLLAIAVAAAGGIAYATNGSTSETIVACAQKSTGLLRVVGSATECGQAETVVSWPGEGVSVQRFVWGAPPSSNKEVTALGTGSVGFPAEGETETEILPFSLAPGKYNVMTTIGVFKNSGHVELLCYIRIPSIGGGFAFMRTALGTDLGHLRLTTLHSNAAFDFPGGPAALVCIQDASQGGPTGENPFVFIATVNATKVASITSTRVP